jgi:hypothetical protein
MRVLSTFMFRMSSATLIVPMSVADERGTTADHGITTNVKKKV